MASTIAQGVGVINSVALRSFMGPAAMGIWNILQVILGYCGYSSFGTTKAMARDYPVLRGRGHSEKAEHLKDVTLTFSMLMSVIPAAIILGVVILRWDHIENPFRSGLLFLIPFLFMQRFYDLILTLLQSDKKFEILSRLMIVNAVGGLAVTLFFVVWWNIYGLMFGTVLLTGSCFFYVHKCHPYRFRFYWNLEELLRQLKLGIPLLTVTFLGQFFKSMDRLIIAKQLGFYDVGLYSITMMASAYISSIPMKFQNVLYPNMLQKFGKTDSASAVQGYLIKPSLIFSIFIPFMSGITIFLMPLVIHLFLSEFSSGIAPMKIYLVSIYFMILTSFSYNFLITIDKYMIAIPITLLSIALNYVLNMAFLAQGWGLTGIAVGTTISYIFRGIVTYFFAMRSVKTPAGTCLDILVFSSVALSLFGGIFTIDHFIRASNIYGESILKLLIFFCFSAPFFWVLEKKTGILKLLLEIISKKKAVRTAPDVTQMNGPSAEV